MNRGGLAGSAFEFDDRFTAYDAVTIAAMGLQGGKMLVRIAADDPATVATLESCAQAVNELSQRCLIAMLEPFISQRVDVSPWPKHWCDFWPTNTRSATESSSA